MLREVKEIKPFDIDLIQPNKSNYRNPTQGGSKIAVIGKPGTGKSTLIKSLLYLKQDIFPCGIFMSGSEESNAFYQEFVPNIFIYNQYEESVFKRFKERQKIAKNYLRDPKNPWAVCVMDDCMNDSKILCSPLQRSAFMNGRHWKMLYIIVAQYAMDLKPYIRSLIDGAFLLRETNLTTLETLWKNYAGIIPTFSLFQEYMKALTGDYTAMYINNATTSTNYEDCIYWYKAQPPPDTFRFGSDLYWDFDAARMDPNYYSDAVFR